MEPTIATTDRETASADVDVDRDAASEEPVAEELVIEELVIEEISIDGMCGVY